MKRIIYTSFALLLLAACGGGDVRQTLGLNRSAPDEFKVVSRPPLSVPPEFHLRPPAPGEPSIAEPSTEKAAESLVIGEPEAGDLTVQAMEKPTVETAVDPVIARPVGSAAEVMFLGRAGAEKADPKIRELLLQERVITPEAQKQDYPLARWLGIEIGDPVVDPKAEAERIRENKDEGKPVNEGEVKTFDPAKASVLDKLFE